MSDDYDGVEVIDLNGTSLGKVGRTYIDDANTPRYVEVKFGALLPKHRMIPIAGSQMTGDGSLQVPYDRDTIESSPDAPGADTLESTDLERIDSYYAGRGEQHDATLQPAPLTGEPPEDEGPKAANQGRHNQFEIKDESAGGLQVGDLVPAGMEAPVVERGDIVEVPVLEEVLTKKTVVREILRVKKSDVVAQEMVEGDIRKETLELDDPSGSVTDSNVESTAR